MGVDIDPWEEFGRAFSEAYPPSIEGHKFDGLLAILGGYRRAQQEPWPLCIDGHEYRRRQKRRTKSKRNR